MRQNTHSLKTRSIKQRRCSILFKDSPTGRYILCVSVTASLKLFKGLLVEEYYHLPALQRLQTQHWETWRFTAVIKAPVLAEHIKRWHEEGASIHPGRFSSGSVNRLHLLLPDMHHFLFIIGKKLKISLILWMWCCKTEMYSMNL